MQNPRSHTVYGPVPSWRFGRSLGIDVTTPPKKCTFNCVYCQLGRTIVHVENPEELGETVSPGHVLDNLDKALNQIDLKTVDVVTFSGTGEPTLNPNLGDIARKVRERIGSLPMVILTNASLLHRRDVRRALSRFDMIVAKLDAGDDKALRLINRPKSDTLNIETIINSTKKMKEESEGRLALEVMLLESDRQTITNVDGIHLQRLLKAIVDIEPDIVQFLVPYRPPSEDYVRIPSPQKVRSISGKLAEELGEERLWVYGKHDRRGRAVRRITLESPEQEILKLLKRRPCRATDVSSSLGISRSDASRLLIKMEKERLIVSERLRGQSYFFHRE